MTEVNRDYLILPTPEEISLAFDSMAGGAIRASKRGIPQEEFLAIRHENANRTLADNPHLANYLAKTSERFVLLATSEKMTPDEVFLAGAKDLLELLLRATTYSQLPEL